MAMIDPARRCRECGVELPTQTAGRPRLRCTSCSPNERRHRPCAVEGCERIGTRRLCETHRARRSRGRLRGECQEDGCEWIAVHNGYCRRHRELRAEFVRIGYSICHCGALYAHRLGRARRPHCPPILSKNGVPVSVLPRALGLLCVVCGKPARRNARTAYPTCSNACYRASERAQAARHTARARRRARKHSQLVDRIYRRRVFERDGWVCGLCGKPVNPDAVVPHPKAPTVDHIIPFAADGEHSYANVQCAHFICNSKKGAGQGQLRLGV